ncbi:MAG: hypothetical protein M3300_14645 [Actinomycetota bacterium]|jgi:hypothetical protein|nr:hypothetical protein [Actinomycetota bacterium]
MGTYRPLLAQRLRGPVMVAIMLAIIVIAVLGMHYADQDMPGRLDGNLDALISHGLRRDQPIARGLTAPGHAVPRCAYSPVAPQ